MLHPLEAKSNVDGVETVVNVFLAAGGLGLTAILCANKEPFKAWGAHLASFGAQAALVADSPFYKLLIGRVMGYKEVNIIHHIKVGQMVINLGCATGNYDHDHTGAFLCRCSDASIHQRQTCSVRA